MIDDETFRLNSPKHALSLFVYINEDGLVVYKHDMPSEENDKQSNDEQLMFKYERTLIQNQVELTYR